MNATISGNYRQLDSSEVDSVAAECAAAWRDPQIPMRQFEMVVRDEIAGYRNGERCAPFDALLNCLRPIVRQGMSLLDIGAASGYYSEVLKIGGLDIDYTGFDFSQSFRVMAELLYPGIKYQIGDARAIPVATESFDIVLTSAVIMHVREYEKCIHEAARVARDYVIFHRTPVFMHKPTAYFVKEAYGVPCLEIHFNEAELRYLFARNGLFLSHQQDVFWNAAEDFGHRTYVTQKIRDVEPYASDKAV